MRDVLCIKSDVKRAKSAARSNHRARTGELELRRNNFWTNLSLAKMLYLDNFIYKLDMSTIFIKCSHDQVQQAMLEEEEKIMAPTLVPVMSHIK